MTWAEAFGVTQTAVCRQDTEMTSTEKNNTANQLAGFILKPRNFLKFQPLNEGKTLLCPKTTTNMIIKLYFCDTLPFKANFITCYSIVRI